MKSASSTPDSWLLVPEKSPSRSFEDESGAILSDASDIPSVSANATSSKIRRYI